MIINRNKSNPIYIDRNLPYWAVLFNKKLNDENWSANFFRESLSQYHPELVKNQPAMEKMILLLHGLNLHKTEDGNLDFEYSLNFFTKSIQLLNDIFGRGNMAALHLIKMLNASAPGFFKNLIFKGGPNLNERIISIKDKDTLNLHINNFNKYLSTIGITVDPLQIINECNAVLKKM